MRKITIHKKLEISIFSQNNDEKFAAIDLCTEKNVNKSSIFLFKS